MSSNIAHLVKTQLYSDAAGVMKVGFAVDLQDSDALAWRSDGMYGASPDIALVLPAKFSRYTSVVDNVTRAVWSANPDRKSAIQLRGIWFKDEAGNVVSSALVRGKKYTVEIPVYNASFKAPNGNVSIEMRLRKVADSEENDKDLGLLDTQTFSIGGWKKNTEDNKATVKFSWMVPATLAAGEYDLYFVIDPKGEIAELHENWDSVKDPGGNNVGRYPIAVLEKEPETYTTAAGDVSIASVSESDFKMLFRPIDADDTREWLTFDEFRAELADMDEDFRAYAKVVYSGSDTLTNLYLDALRVDTDGTENRIATRVIPALFPNTERELSFIVSPKKAKNGFFTVDITGDGTALHWPKDSNSGSSSSGSSGCDGGFGGVALLAVAAALIKRAYHVHR